MRASTTSTDGGYFICGINTAGPGISGELDQIHHVFQDFECESMLLNYRVVIGMVVALHLTCMALAHHLSCMAHASLYGSCVLVLGSPGIQSHQIGDCSRSIRDDTARNMNYEFSWPSEFSSRRINSGIVLWSTMLGRV